VAWGDFNLLKLPAGTEHENDFTMLSDIFPTGYHGTELAGVTPGDTVAIFGAGPVGLLAAHSAALRGAAQIFVVDKEPGRLAPPKKYGATPVNFADADPHPSLIVSHELPLDQAPDAYARPTGAKTAGPRSCCTRPPEPTTARARTEGRKKRPVYAGTAQPGGDSS
jgi:threonine dehydrogenase-like Zn-dependent dehydrogenase